MSGFLDDRSRLVDLEQGQAVAAGDVEQDAPGAVDGDVQQLAGDSHFSRKASPVFTAGVSDCHERGAAFRHNGAHVSEVEVDHARHSDQFGDSLNALAQHIVSSLEGFCQADLLVDDLQQAVIGDDDQRISVFF